ncbi:MAG: D-alanyl-D-alanine carboxypeptidase [Clostridia bacterium]|nr:D-alanyl-D-alanine carboxypeptidase [Clostridia bacterium]
MKITKIFCIILSLLQVFCITVNANLINRGISLSAKASVLMRSDNNEVISCINGDMRLPMASTTKIMTAIVVLEKAKDIEALYKIPGEACGIEGSSAYLRLGESLSIKELLYALMLSSANDAAVALAICISNSVEDFAGLMNKKAAQLGLKNTHFTNPNGLDNDEHYTTANDLALIMAYAMKNPIFCEITATKTYKCTSKGNEERYFSNHNKLLDIYKGCVGGKTGFTKRSGRCLVSCAQKNGVELVCVTLNAPDDWNDHCALFDYGFGCFQRITLVSKGQYCYTLPVINGEKENVLAYAMPCEVIINTKSKKAVKAVCELKHFYFADIEKGELLGRILFLQDGKVIAESDVIASSSVKSIEYKNLFQRLISLFH